MCGLGMRAIRDVPSSSGSSGAGPETDPDRYGAVTNIDRYLLAAPRLPHRLSE